MRKKNKARILIAIIVVCLLLTGVVIPLTIALADDLTATLDFVTGVSLKQRDGSPLPADIEKDALFTLTYDFQIPNIADVFDGDTFRLPIPDEIIISQAICDDPSLVPPSIKGVSDLDIATISYDSGTPGLLLTFTDYAQNYSDIMGAFDINLQFDENNIGTDDPAIITFEVGGSTGTTTVEVDFDQPPPPVMTVEKTGGAYNVSTGEIEWTITVNPEQVTFTDGVLVDDIPSGLTFVPGSMTVKEGAAAERAAVLDTDYTYSDPTMTYTFPTPTSDTYIVKFRTTVDKTEFIFADSHGTTIPKNNSVTLNYNGISIEDTSNDVDIDINYIEKTGSYDSADKQIDWTIYINQMGVTIPDAVLTDALPAGLTLDVSSLEIDDNPQAVSVAPDPQTDAHYDAPDITINIGAILGSISEVHKIEFSTDVDPTVYEENQTESYTNTAVLTGTNVPGNASDPNDNPVGVTSNVLNKSGVAYDPETAEITWRIVVNTNVITIQDPVITDLIPTGQEYVPGSARISGGSESHADGFDFDGTDIPADPPTHDGYTGTLTYNFGTMSGGPPAVFVPGGNMTIDEVYTIEFETTVTDPDVYAANRSNVTYRNTATMESDNLPDESDEGTQRVDSEVIQKTNQGYNYLTREIDWCIQVNQNAMDLDNVVVTDMIQTGQEYVPGSFAISGGPEAHIEGLSFDGTDIPEDPPNHDGYTGTLTYTFGTKPAGTFVPGGTMTDEYIITFKTVVSDITVFETNGTKNFDNSVTIATDLVPAGVSSSDTQPVNNTVIGKTGDYTLGNTFIDWTITVNTNDIPLVSGLITDQLQEGLALDTTSVKLYHATANATNGSLVQGSEITLDGTNVVYNVDTRLFEFNIPAPVVGGYILTFSTDVVDKDQSPFVNSADFNGSGQANTGNENPIAVAWSGSGSWGTGDVGSIDVLKVDAENNTNMLEGAEFELEDKYGNIVQRMTTDPGGSALFERIRFDVPYIVRETAPPTGYQLSAEEYAFQITGNPGDKDISYTFENDIIKGHITFTKHGENADPLAGAVFTLYDSDTNPVTTATSGADGVVLFENIDYGEYTIEETTPPEGYLPNDTVLTASITEYEVTVDATPNTITNTIIRGNVSVIKLDEDEATPLAGAQMSLFASGDTEFTTAIDTQTSGADGAVLFENVAYGDYVIKETAAPTSYALSDKMVNVTVAEQDVTVDAGTYTNAKIRTTIEVLKNNIYGDPLEGATFTLYDEHGVPLAKATSGPDGIARFENVPYGYYTVKETNPPHMYLVSDEIMVANVLAGEVVHCLSVDERSPDYPWSLDSPGTGDNIEVYLWLFVFCLILLVVVYAIDKRIKKSRKTRRLRRIM